MRKWAERVWKLELGKQPMSLAERVILSSTANWSTLMWRRGKVSVITNAREVNWYFEGKLVSSGDKFQCLQDQNRYTIVISKVCGTFIKENTSVRR